MSDQKDTLMGHGMSRKQLDDFHYNQIHNQVKKIPANRAKLINDKFFKEEFSDYEIAEHDAMHYHVIQEARVFDQQTGDRKTKPVIQIYNEAMFNFMTKNDGFKGMITFVIHDPQKAEKIDNKKLN